MSETSSPLAGAGTAAAADTDAEFAQLLAQQARAVRSHSISPPQHGARYADFKMFTTGCGTQLQRVSMCLQRATCAQAEISQSMYSRHQAGLGGWRPAFERFQDTCEASVRGTHDLKLATCAVSEQFEGPAGCCSNDAHGD